MLYIRCSVTGSHEILECHFFFMFLSKNRSKRFLDVYGRSMALVLLDVHVHTQINAFKPKRNQITLSKMPSPYSLAAFTTPSQNLWYQHPSTVHQPAPPRQTTHHSLHLDTLCDWCWCGAIKAWAQNRLRVCDGFSVFHITLNWYIPSVGIVHLVEQILGCSAKHHEIFGKGNF